MSGGFPEVGLSNFQFLPETARASSNAMVMQDALEIKRRGWSPGGHFLVAMRALRVLDEIPPGRFCVDPWAKFVDF